MKTTIKKTSKIITVILFTTTLIFTSCKKADPGPTGATGATGAAGANGVANITNQIITVTPGSWSYGGSGFWSYSAYDFNITDINQDAVIVYFYAGSSQYVALPASDAFVSGDNLTFSFLPDQINFIYLNSTAPTSTTTYRVVVIPPAMMKPNVDYKNYQSVKNAFNLKD